MTFSIATRLCTRFVLALLLSGVAFIAFAQTPAIATDAARPNPQQVAADARLGARDDSRIASAVAALLLRQPALEAVSVEVHAGVVTLAGKVPEDVDRARATTLAKQVRGVTDVIDTTRLDANLRTRFDSALDQVKGKFIRLLAATPLLVAAIAIVLLAAWLGRYFATRTYWLRLRSRNPYMDGLVRRIIQTLAVLAGVLVALDLLGATALVGAVIGSAGVIGLAFGFAFKDIAENYIAGILLSLRRPFAPGDHLVIEKFEGKVVALTSRATLLMTLDGSQLTLPNALVFKSVVLNYSANPRRRFDFTTQLDVGESIRGAQKLALEQIAAVEGILHDPAPSSVVECFGSAGITLRFHGWIDQRKSDINKVRSEAVRAVKAAFATAGVQPPRSVQYVIATQETQAAQARATRSAPVEPAEGGDTSVNRDIDAQLAAAQEATDAHNLLDDPPEGDMTARTP